MSWNLKNFVMDMRDISIDNRFDHITSICVYEHIPLYDRVVINSSIRNMLIPGGRFSITFDYKNLSHKAQINTPKAVYDQFKIPSNLTVRGNPNLIDSDQSYLLHPFYYSGFLWGYKLKSIIKRHFWPLDLISIYRKNDYTNGALFLEKSLN